MSDLRGARGCWRFPIPDSDSVAKIVASLQPRLLSLGYARSVPLFSGQFAIVTNANFDILYLNAHGAGRTMEQSAFYLVCTLSLAAALNEAQWERLLQLWHEFASGKECVRWQNWEGKIVNLFDIKINKNYFLLQLNSQQFHRLNYKHISIHN